MPNPYLPSEVLHLWEDDYLMIELLPVENIDFVKFETKRIENFGNEHFDGTGFTDITPIGEKLVKTLDRKIQLDKISEIFSGAGLKRIDKVVMQDIGFLEDTNAPFGFGTNNFAILFDIKKDIVENIWLAGQVSNLDDRKKLVNGLYKFGKSYNFLGVNWFRCKYYDLRQKDQVETLIEISC